ncbi:BON domain-containing protein [Azovibrio restrictus]|uniref:BON domain-containing protein n=1 Tax=Azovibrio restrictus TaxID=146938 RepID=UPI00040F4A42|nr:BON domain-containing protein [Azovibrio restrictus]MCE1171278.1 BON domain-containing protein [Azovibrio sp.]
MMRGNLRHAGLGLVLALAVLGLGASATDNQGLELLAALGEARQTLDQSLGEQVGRHLQGDGGLTGASLRVEARDGVVTLVGQVPDQHALQRAMHLAAAVKGVREVRNNLVISPPV